MRTRVRLRVELQRSAPNAIERGPTCVRTSCMCVCVSVRASERARALVVEYKVTAGAEAARYDEHTRDLESS